MPVARGALRGQGRIAVGEADRGTLGIASIAKQPPSSGLKRWVAA
jgi:hypothetical protein